MESTPLGNWMLSGEEVLLDRTTTFHVEEVSTILMAKTAKQMR